MQNTRSLFFILLLIIAQPLFAHADRDTGLQESCANEFKNIELCCLQGLCANAGQSYALTVEAEDIRPLREACFAVRGEEAPRCPKGRRIQQQNYYYSGTLQDENSSTLTRLLLISLKNEDAPIEKNKATIELLKNQKRLCLNELDDMIGKGPIARSTYFLRRCDPSYLARITELRKNVTETFTALLQEPSRRQKKDDRYLDPLLQNFVTLSCPYVQKWNDVFSQEQIKSLNNNLPGMQKRLQTMIQEGWGELDEQDKKILFSRECIHIKTVRSLCAHQPETPYGKKIPCDGNIHHTVQINVPSIRQGAAEGPVTQ